MKFLISVTLCALVFAPIISAYPIDDDLEVPSDFVSHEDRLQEYMKLMAPQTDPGIIMDAYLTTPQLLKNMDIQMKFITCKHQMVIY